MLIFLTFFLKKFIILSAGDSLRSSTFSLYVMPKHNILSLFLLWIFDKIFFIIELVIFLSMRILELINLILFFSFKNNGSIGIQCPPIPITGFKKLTLGWRFVILNKFLN